MIRPIPPDELEKALGANSPWHLFDLRDAGAYVEGHIPGARHVPLAQALRWIPQRAETHETVVLIDEDGRPGGPARRVAAELAARWFRHLRYLDGGMAAWGPGRPRERGGPAGERAASAEGCTRSALASKPVPWRVSERPLPPDPERRLPALEGSEVPPRNDR
ncbi:MAG: rhodanese-like domain-containing protein [Acidobacteria bacterium]|nr:MAG: rhodanese-like domain-containing protein [Acidobacteriota bacterium]